MLTNTCRVCRRPLFSLLDLGMMKLPWFPKARDPNPIPEAPLHLMGCDECGLVQLSDTVEPDLLYRQYWYRSEINELMREELTAIVKQALLHVSVFEADYVVDIGANDGYLLSQYPRQRAHWQSPRIAYEPAFNLKELCARHCELLVNDYFPAGVAKREGIHHAAKIVTSIAMFYDLDDPRTFVEAIDHCLHEDGLWILQFQDLAQMVEAGAIDNVCHEHLTYWSLASFCWFLGHTGLDLHVVHAERRAINGGSLRIHVRRKLWPAAATVEDLLNQELHSIGWAALGRFAWQADQMRNQVQGLVQRANDAGYTIDLYGASTKASTLLQYCGLSHEQIRCAWERNAEKFGRVTATGIPIVDEAAGRRIPPELLLVGIWQFRELILEREEAFVAGGGRLLFPLPEVELVHGDTPTSARL